MDSDGRMIYTVEGDRLSEPQFTPGANLAKQRGCTCSRLDNKWGQGRLIPDPELGWDSCDIEYTITPNCPLHDARVEHASNHQDQRQGDLDASTSGMDGTHASDHSG